MDAPYRDPSGGEPKGWFRQLVSRVPLRTLANYLLPRAARRFLRAKYLELLLILIVVLAGEGLMFVLGLVNTDASLYEYCAQLKWWSVRATISVIVLRGVIHTIRGEK